MVSVEEIRREASLTVSLMNSGNAGALNVPSRLPPFVSPWGNVFVRENCALTILAPRLRHRASLPAIIEGMIGRSQYNEGMSQQEKERRRESGGNTL